MAFQVSPGVLVQEKDLTRIISGLYFYECSCSNSSNTRTLDEITSISSEQELV